MYSLRRSVEKDIPQIMEIISAAQAYFSRKGIQQWQNGYPNAEVISNDLRKGNSYVLLEDILQAGRPEKTDEPEKADERGKIIATVMISFDGEPTYAHIDGQWITDGSYAVIHRLAVRPELKGKNIAGWIIGQVEQMCAARNCPSIRIDTHQENHSMQQVAAKNGFQYCGIITLADGALRLAYEKRV